MRDVESKSYHWFTEYLAFFLPCLFIFLPVLQTHYLHTDDYFWSHWGGWNLKAVFGFMNPIGRPAAALLYHAFSFIPDFKLTYLFRLLSVANIALAALLFFRWLVSSSVEKRVAFLVSLSVVTFPAFQVFVSYVSTIPHGISVTLSLAALVSRKVWISILYLVLACCFNQVGAFFFVAGLASRLVLVSNEDLIPWLAREGKRKFLVFVTGIGVYYVLFRIYVRIAKNAIGGKYDPTQFVVDYVSRLRWFYQEALFEAANLWNLDAGLTIPYLLMGICLLCLLFEGKKGLLRWPLAVASLYIGFAPSLLSSSPSLEYRTYPVISAISFCLPTLAFYRLISKQDKKGIFFAFLAVVCLLGSIRANLYVNRYFAFPDSIEFKYVRNHLLRYRLTGKPLKAIHINRSHSGFAGPVERHEMGEPTLRHVPNIEPMVRAAISESGFEGDIRVTSSESLSGEWLEFKPKSPDKVDFFMTGFAPNLNQEGLLVVDMSQIDLK